MLTLKLALLLAAQPLLVSLSAEHSGFARPRAIKAGNHPSWNQEGQSTVVMTLRGRVVDARTGEPISKVKIIANKSQKSATTDEHGAFIIEDLPPGEVELYVTTVNYGLFKKTILLKAGDNAEVEIALNQEAATLTEQVNVIAGPYVETETNAASVQTLNKTELQELSKVLVGDPIRAAQALPGVTSNNDLRAEFAVRGAGFDRVGVYVDGVLTDNFLHNVQSDGAERASISVINTDTISAVSLLTGAFPAKYGDSTGAVLNLETREGNRIKPAFRFSTGLQVGTSGVVDGPFAGKRGSYLFAARTSVLDYLSRLVDRISDDSVDTTLIALNDAQARVNYDLSTRHQIGISTIYGKFRFEEEGQRERIGLNSVFRSESRNFLVNAYYNFTANPQLFVQTRVFGLQTNLTNKNRDELVLNDEPRIQLGVRSDINFLVRPAHRVEAGFYIRSLRGEGTRNFILSAQPLTRLNLETFSRRAAEQSFYAQDTYTSERLGLSLTGGGRIEHSGLTGETLLSPRAALQLALGSDYRIRAGFGRHHQFPDFAELYGRLPIVSGRTIVFAAFGPDPRFGRIGNPNAQAERSTHYNLSIERTFGNRLRVLAEVYDREDANLLFSLSEPRLESGLVSITEFPVRNALRGHARGIELTLQRRSANKLAGWVTYSYAQTRLRDEASRLQFVSDFDQRHTLNAYGSYRLTETFNLSSQWRYGSGVPIPGFFERSGPDLFLASERNRLRLPAYSRVDVRAVKAFLFKRFKLTLSGEVLNVLNRTNERYPIFQGVDQRTGRVLTGSGDRLPILPAVGVAIEF